MPPIKLIPNTGHHYHFIPVKDLPLDVQRVCARNNTGWEVGRMKDAEEDTPWLRYRPGTKEIDGAQVPGLWIAIETNVGRIQRGSVIGETRASIISLPEGVDENSKASLKKSPYAYESVEELMADAAGADQTGVSVFELKIKDAKPGKEVTYLPNPVKIEIIWMKPGSTIDVDLVVDFGNTRTVVLAIERNAKFAGNPDALASVCRPIFSLRRGHEYPDETVDRKELEAIVDSWFLLQEPIFSSWDFQPKSGSLKKKAENLYEKAFSYEYAIEYPEQKTWDKLKVLINKETPQPKYFCTTRKPQMFVEVSPVLMGREARELLQSIDIEVGYNISMSSPKRYLWDRKMIDNRGGQLSWGLNRNTWTAFKNKGLLPNLEGEICRYTYADGRYWDISEPPTKAKAGHQPSAIPENPNYPRSSAMVWSALSILENAYRQITSEEWRKSNIEFAARRLSSINVTFPSGWIAKEKEYYREAWQQAVNIFTLTHMESAEPIAGNQNPFCDGQPELFMDLDEAVASQLPFIYSEINRLGNANLWIQLYGRKDKEKGKDFLDNTIRVMTVDIGGGTMDSTIIEYRNTLGGQQMDLRYKILFRDCSSFAGDEAMLKIIERVLLPAILTKKTNSEELIDIFLNELAKTKSQLGIRAKWNRIITNFFVPVVQRWLTDMAKNASRNEQGEIVYKTPAPLSMEECGADPSAIEDFNNFMKKALKDAQVDMSDEDIASMDLIQGDDRLSYSPELIDECIRTALENGIIPLGSFVAAYDVDVVTLSGKISEMPCVADLLRRYLPIREQRIIPMKNYLAGGWYPMATRGRINDAKTVTAVGAAYYAAQKNNLLGTGLISEDIAPGYQDTQEAAIATRNYWGILPDGNASGFEPFMNRDELDNSKRKFHIEDGSEVPGTPVSITSKIGRMKYMSKKSTPEMQYEIVWEGEGPQPQHVLAASFGRIEDGTDDDIELIDIAATDPSEAERVNMDTVKLRLKTMSPQGFWKEECVFNVSPSDLEL